MLAIIYLIASLLAGVVVVQRFLPEHPPFVRIAGAFVSGLLGTAWETFLCAYALSPFLDNPVLAGSLLALGANIALIGWGRRYLRISAFRLSLGELLFAAGALAFSFWLMDARLGGDPLTVSANTWGDTALHVAIARSFSWGHNFPPEYPFYGGDPIRYHFGYDFFAGALEAQGLPIAWAFNLPGAIAFACIMMLVFELGRSLFKNVWVGLLTVVLLITNGSLAFLKYLDTNDWNLWDAISNLWDHQNYLNVGPYFVNGEIDKISIFWTLNVFLTQTHLIVGMALVLFVAYCLVRRLRDGAILPTNEALALGVLFGISFWLNGVLFIAAMVFFIALFFVYGRNLSLLPLLAPVVVILMLLGWGVDAHFYFLALVFALGSMFVLSDLRQSIPFLVVAGLLALPQAVWLNGGLHNDGSISQHTGYLVCSSPQESCYDSGLRFDQLSSYKDFVWWWWLNLGVVGPLVALAAVWLRGRDRRLLLAVMAIFIFGNFVQLSRDLGGHNHKVFNLWEVLLNVFAAFAIVQAWQLATRGVEVARGRLDNQSLLGAAVAVGALAGLIAIGVGVSVGVLAGIKIGPPAGVAIGIGIGVVIAAVVAVGVGTALPGWTAVRVGVVAVILPVIILFIVLSGLIDFMTIKNDKQPGFEVFDGYQTEMDWIDKNTPGDSLFLIKYGDLYSAPALAGRRVFLGFEPWASSAGYNVVARTTVANAIYTATSKVDACRLLRENKIDYVQVGPAERSGDRFPLNEGLFTGQFTAAGKINDPGGQTVIYDVGKSCPPSLVSG